jgi:hypothetical protein
MLATAILGYNYNAATVLSLLDYESAKAFEDIVPIHNAVYSQLPAGTPRDVKDLVYVKIRTSTGKIRILALNWIAAQPTLVTTAVAVVTIANVGVEQFDTIRQLLIANGFNQLTIASL